MEARDIRELTIADEELAMMEMASDINNPISYSLILASKLCYLAVGRMYVDGVETDKKGVWQTIPRNVHKLLQDKVKEHNSVSAEIKKK